MGWRRVLSNLESLYAAHYRGGEGISKCMNCVYFARQASVGYPQQELRAGVCGEHNVTVGPEMTCDDFKLHSESPKNV